MRFFNTEECARCDMPKREESCYATRPFLLVHLFLGIIRLLVRRKSAGAASSSVIRRRIPSSRLNGAKIGGLCC